MICVVVPAFAQRPSLRPFSGPLSSVMHVAYSFFAPSRPKLPLALTM